MNVWGCNAIIRSFVLNFSFAQLFWASLKVHLSLTPPYYAWLMERRVVESSCEVLLVDLENLDASRFQLPRLEANLALEHCQLLVPKNVFIPGLVPFFLHRYHFLWPTLGHYLPVCQALVSEKHPMLKWNGMSDGLLPSLGRLFISHVNVQPPCED